MLDFREVQRQNLRMTWALLSLFVVLLFLLGAGVDVWLTLRTGAPPPFPFGSLGGVAAGLGIAAASYYGGARAVMASVGARRIDDPKTPEERLFSNVVSEMAIAAGLPRPTVWIVDDPDPNAFAAGRSPETASVAATSGLIASLSREELQAVVAHEMSHVRNYDVRLMTLVAALGGAIVLMADMIGRVLFRSRVGGGGGGRRGGKGGGAGALLVVLFVVWAVFVALSPLIVRLLALAISRKREYLADATAAELTRNPAALAGALEKIAAAVEPTRSIKQGVAHLCIHDPLGRAVNEREGTFADLFATHPPVAARIAALRAMAGAPA